MHWVNANVLEDYKDDTETFQNILWNKCTDVEECHKTDILNDFEKLLEFDKGIKRYKVKLPFNAKYDFLADNFDVAKNRLLNLKQKLLKNENLARTYDDIFNEYLKKGIIEKVDDTSKVSKNFHSLPHHPVIKNERGTTKTRILLDAPSKSKNEICHNNALYSGPCLLSLLYNILLRFRIGKIGIIADIKQTFLQIFIDDNDRDLIRFLWFENINDPWSKIVIYRFTRVVFGLNSSPFLLNATLQHQLSKYLPIADISFYIEKLMRDLYVDDSTNSFDEVHEWFFFSGKVNNFSKFQSHI